MFDLEMHQRVERGEALTADQMNAVMADLLQAGYGPHVAVDRDRDGCLWTQFSTHLYSNFYAYQYTTGIAGAHALADGLLKGRPAARDNYRAFLNAGDSLYPVDALKLAGVDLTAPHPIEQHLPCPFRLHRPPGGAAGLAEWKSIGISNRQPEMNMPDRIYLWVH